MSLHCCLQYVLFFTAPIICGMTDILFYADLNDNILFETYIFTNKNDDENL